jgi:hypothetical protein
MDSLCTAKGYMVEHPTRGRWQSGVLVPITGKYLRIGLNIFAGTSARHAADFPNVAEWVDSPVRATVDSAENAKETQRKLAELGIETHCDLKDRLAISGSIIWPFGVCKSCKSEVH